MSLYESKKEFKRLKDVKCGDPEDEKRGLEMQKWISETLSKWEGDSSIVWKATIQHHPIFGKWYADYLNIT